MTCLLFQDRILAYHGSCVLIYKALCSYMLLYIISFGVGHY